MTTAENSVADSTAEIKLVLTPRQNENFWNKVSKAPHPKGCWEWTANRHYKGYGLFGFGRKTHKTHRVAYRLTKGEIPDGIQVCHHCDNPPCVNPEHLFLGTNKQNSDDMMAKGRNKPLKGEANKGGGKLTWENVREIRALRATGLSQQSIADKFAVSQPMIGLIVRGEKWKEEDHIVTSLPASQPCLLGS